VLAACLAAAAALAGCDEAEQEAIAPPEPQPTVVPPTSGQEQVSWRPVPFAELVGWNDDAPDGALAAFRRSCRVFAKRGGDEPVGADDRAGRVRDWQEVCDLADGVPSPAGTIDPERARAFFETTMTPIAVTGANGAEGVFTGYYEAELDGARNRDETYTVPLYGRPADLVTVGLGGFDAGLEGRSIVGRVEDGKLLPYPERVEIDGGALAGRGLEIVWVDDPVDAFILHIQGSGRVRLDDGTTIRVGYAASNGRPFVGIGRLMLDRGLIEPGQADMMSIRAWLRDHPHQAAALMAENPRYIFFREIEGDGPIGAQGIALIAGRSIAVDPAFVPLGAPIWLDTTWPGDSDRPLRRLVVAQDIGAAIKGPVRGDLFWGAGEAALAEAGRMKQAGRYFLLLPNAVAAALPGQG